MKPNRNIIAVAATLLAGAAHAETVTLGFNSLPSAQGWTQSGVAPGAEATVASVNGTQYIQNGTAGGGTAAFYTRTIATLGSGDFWLDVRAQITAFSGDPVGTFNNLGNFETVPNPYGFSFGVATANGYYFAGIAGPRFALFNLNTGVGESSGSIFYAPHGLDLSVARDYSLVRESGTLTFRVDGNVITTFVNDEASSPEVLLLGDGTSGGSANAIVSNYRFSTEGPFVAPGAVPEPASWAMLIAGFGLTGAALRRRRINGVSVSA